MDYTYLGRTGVKVSHLCLGCMSYGIEAGIVQVFCVGTLAVLLTAGVMRSQSQADEPVEVRYLAFQVFTCGPDPKIPMSGGGMKPLGSLPDKAALRDYIKDIKRRIGTVGDRQTRLAVMLGQLCFDHADAEVTRFIELAFSLALETDVAVGFHIDDSMFWARRKDLWSDPNNVEATDWDGTPCTGRRLDWDEPDGCATADVL